MGQTIPKINKEQKYIEYGFENFNIIDIKQYDDFELYVMKYNLLKVGNAEIKKDYEILRKIQSQNY
ncbi:hypothetical protein EBU95_21925 [bacterium]|nr:hypothetical protein [bacterium]